MEVWSHSTFLHSLAASLIQTITGSPNEDHYIYAFAECIVALHVHWSTTDRGELYEMSEHATRYSCVPLSFTKLMTITDYKGLLRHYDNNKLVYVGPFLLLLSLYSVELTKDQLIAAAAAVQFISLLGGWGPHRSLSHMIMYRPPATDYSLPHSRSLQFIFNSHNKTHTKHFWADSIYTQRHNPIENLFL